MAIVRLSIFQFHQLLRDKKNASTSAISAYDKVGLIRSTSVSTKCKKTIVTNVHVTIPSANIFLGIYKLKHECTRLFTTFIYKLDLNSQISQCLPNKKDSNKV